MGPITSVLEPRVAPVDAPRNPLRNIEKVMIVKIAGGIDTGQSAPAGEGPAFGLLGQHHLQPVEQIPIWTIEITAFYIEIASVKFVAQAAL